MKIAFVLPGGFSGLPPTGSIPILTQELSRRLVARSHQVTVYSLRANCSEPKRVVHLGVTYENVGRYVEHILQPLTGSDRFLKRLARPYSPTMPAYTSSLHHLGYALAVAWRLRKESADIIHVHNRSQFAWILKWLNPESKLVLHMHCEWLSQLEQSVLNRRLRNVDLVVGCSNHVVDKARRRSNLPSVIWQTIPNGVDIDQFTPRDGDEIEKINLPDSAKILYVGRVSPEKGIHVLLAAFQQIAKFHPGIRLEIIGKQLACQYSLLVGVTDDGPTRALERFYPQPRNSFKSRFYYFSYLQKNIDPSLRDRITFIEQLPHEELAERYRFADIFVFPSLSDAFGMPVVEAMAAGLPIIASRAGGPSEIVEHGVTGMLVERDDAQALSDSMSLLIRNPALRKSIGKQARRIACEKYAWSNIGKCLETAYTNLTGHEYL